MAYTAPVYGQVGGLAVDPTDVERNAGFDFTSWLADLDAGRAPTRTPSGEELRQWAQQADQATLARAISARRTAQERMAQMGGRRLADGSYRNLTDTEIPLYNALDNNIKTLGDVIKQTSAALEQTGEIGPRTLIPILNPDGSDSGMAANPFNPDGAPINVSRVSPDQQEVTRRTAEQARNAAALSQDATTRAREANQSRLDVANVGIARQEMMNRAAREAAQAARDLATDKANAALIIKQMESEDKTLEEGQKYAKQLADTQDAHRAQHAAAATQLFKDMNENERTWYDGFVKSDQIGEDAREVLQGAWNNFRTNLQEQDTKTFEAQVKQDTERDKGVAALVEKMWTSYTASLKDMYEKPEGWFQALEKAGRTQSYARQLPGLMAQLKPKEADFGKIKEFAEAARGMYGPQREPNYRPLPPPAAEYQRAPLPDMAGVNADNQARLDQALAGTLFPKPDTSFNPLARDYAGPTDLRAALGLDFTAPVAEGMEGRPSPAMDLLMEPTGGPNPMDLLTEDQGMGAMNLGLPLPGEAEPMDLEPTFDIGLPLEEPLGYQAPFVDSEQRRQELEFYEPVLRAAPPELTPVVLDVMAGLATRDDVLVDPESALRDELESALGPYGYHYQGPDPWEEEEEDTFDYFDEDYGGDFYV